MGVFSRVSRKADLENKAAILELLKPLSHARILEIGPGQENLAIAAGRILEASSLSALEYTGCGEPARQAGLLTAECDLNDSPWPLAEASFDVIIANQVLEHIVNTDNFMKEIRRLLAVGGYAIVSVPNLASLGNLVMLALALQPNHCHVSDEFRGLGNPLSGQRMHQWDAPTRQHLRMFTIAGLSDLCRVHGMNVEAMHGGSYGLPVPMISRAMAWLDPWHSVYANVRFTRA